MPSGQTRSAPRPDEPFRGDECPLLAAAANRPMAACGNIVENVAWDERR